MKVEHPRFGSVEVLEESPLFIRINHPVRNYELWLPKSDLDEIAAEQKKVKKPKVKKSPGEKAAAKVSAAAKRTAKEAGGYLSVRVCPVFIADHVALPPDCR
jgi:hypothetical protein